MENKPDLNIENITEPGNYAKMVKHLKKAPEKIILTDEQKDIYHMYMGFVGERNELFECVNNIQTSGSLQDHVVNLVEELGDMLFYCEGMLDALKGPIMALETGAPNEEAYQAVYMQRVKSHIRLHGVINGDYRNVKLPGLTPPLVLGIALDHMGRSLDLCTESLKRHTIYDEDVRKKEGIEPVIHVEQFFDTCASMHANVLVMSASTGIPMELIIQENFKKLWMKRYKDGYSDNAAQKRADKKCPIEDCCGGGECDTDVEDVPAEDTVVAFK